MRVPRVDLAAQEDRPGLLASLERVLPLDGDALDLGTGAGRVALACAPRVRSIVGVDVDEGALEAARWDASRRGVGNVRFVQADAETQDLLAFHDGRPFELVTARLFLSPTVLARLPAWVAPGGHVVLEALEAEHWQEAGGSRFALAAEAVSDALETGSFRLEEARVERTRRTFTGVQEAQAWLKERRFFPKWRADGRWATWQRRLRHGDGVLTEAHVVVRARRPSV